MTPLDALWHILNLVAPGAVGGSLAGLMAKLLWRRELRSTSLRRLCLTAMSGAGVAYASALAIAGRDGIIVAYAAMVLGSALCLWWLLLRARAP